jgi:hypothetical protein
MTFILYSHTMVKKIVMIQPIAHEAVNIPTMVVALFAAFSAKSMVRIREGGVWQF